MAKPTDNSFLPAYLLDGSDVLKRDRVVARLRARLEALGDLSFNSEEFDARSVTGEEIVAACNTLPFMSPYRLIVVKDVDALKKQDSEPLVEYLKNPSDSSVLLLSADKLAKNTRLYKAVSALGKTAVIDCAPPSKRELPRYVRESAVTHGITINDFAAIKLIELVGEDTVALNSELRKLALAHASRDVVTEREVAALVERSAESKPWEFVDAFMKRNLPGCMEVRSRTMSVSLHALLPMCVTRLRELMAVRSCRANSLRPEDVLGLPEWKLKGHRQAVASWSDERLCAAVVAARDAEVAMKSGTDPEDAFMDWVVKSIT